MLRALVPASVVCGFRIGNLLSAVEISEHVTGLAMNVTKSHQIESRRIDFCASFDSLYIFRLCLCVLRLCSIARDFSSPTEGNTIVVFERETCGYI